MDQELQSIIAQTPLISDRDKQFLMAIGGSISTLDKLKLKAAIGAGLSQNVQQFIELMRQKFEHPDQPENPKSQGIFSNLIQQNKPKIILSKSLLTQPFILGSNPPQALQLQNVPPLQSLKDFTHPGQVAFLNPGLVTFDLNQNAEQIIQDFLMKMDKVMLEIENINDRRNFFMNFMKSPLFSSYINTGLAALRHPELEPTEIILNLLNQINSNYLTTKQFQYAAIISNHLRGLCAL